MRRLLAGALATAALGAAPPARAEPIALRDAPRAQDIALSGDEVVIGRTTARGGVRIIAMPMTGGATRQLLALPPAGRETGVLLSASTGVVAALVTDERDDGSQFRVYSGPPSGPLTLRRSVRVARGRWLPYSLDADADQVLLSEGRLARTFGARARVLTPAGALQRVPWDGFMTEAALSGERVAFAGLRRGGRGNGIYVINRRTGAVEASARLGELEDVDEDGVDLAPDGRAVAAVGGRLLTIAPGVPAARSGTDLRQPRFSGAGFAALRESPLDVRRPVIVEGGAARAVGSPSSALEIFEADDRGAAWIANGCVLYAPRDSAPPVEPPHGPCPRAEVVLGDTGRVLRGRRAGVIVRCVAAPAGGCRGSVLLGRGRYGRASFVVPAGRRRTVGVRLTRRGLRLVRRSLARIHEGPVFSLSARVRDGRAHGQDSILVDGLPR